MQLNQLVQIFYNSVIFKSVNDKRFKCHKKVSILGSLNWNLKFLCKKEELLMKRKAFQEYECKEKNKKRSQQREISLQS